MAAMYRMSVLKADANTNNGPVSVVLVQSGEEKVNLTRNVNSLLHYGLLGSVSLLRNALPEHTGPHKRTFSYFYPKPLKLSLVMFLVRVFQVGLTKLS